MSHTAKTLSIFLFGLTFIGCGSKTAPQEETPQPEALSAQAQASCEVVGGVVEKRTTPEGETVYVCNLPKNPAEETPVTEEEASDEAKKKRSQ